MKYPFFAYGTLKQGYGLHDDMVSRFGKGYERLGECVTDLPFSMMDIGYYPLMCDQMKGPAGCVGQVKGELYLVSPEALKDITTVEGGAGYLPVGIEVRALLAGPDEDGDVLEQSVSALAWLHPNPYDNGDWVPTGVNGQILWTRKTG